MSIIAEPKPRSRKASPKRTKSGAKTDAAPRKVPRQRAKAAKPRGARAGTKQALLIDLLKRKTGATIADLVHATSWQPHSVRGVYRIVGRGRWKGPNGRRIPSRVLHREGEARR